MLRDDRQVALNDVLVALQDAAEGHEQAVTALSEREEGRVLERRVETLRRDTEAIAEHLRKLGDRPREADSEYEAVLGLVAQVKATLAPDDVRSLLEDRAAAEARIAETADLALQEEGLPDGLPEMLDRVRSDARAAAAALAGD